VQRHLPAPQRGAALDSPRVGLQRRGAGVVAFDAGAKAVLEVQAAHLAVADDVEADAFLQAYGTAHGVVLDRAQFGGGNLALVETLARLDHGRRPQKAADHVGSDGSQVAHRTLPGKGTPKKPQVMHIFGRPRRVLHRGAGPRYDPRDAAIS